MKKKCKKKFLAVILSCCCLAGIMPINKGSIQAQAGGIKPRQAVGAEEEVPEEDEGFADFRGSFRESQSEADAGKDSNNTGTAADAGENPNGPETPADEGKDSNNTGTAADAGEIPNGPEFPKEEEDSPDTAEDSGEQEHPADMEEDSDIPEAPWSEQPEGKPKPPESGDPEEASETEADLEDTVSDVPLRSLEEVSGEMDSPLRIVPPQRKARAARSAGEPTAEIGKSALWLDIEEGYARIDLTEQDTPAYSNRGVDYLIILDRTRTMALNDRAFQGNSTGTVNSSHSPCLNRNHSYEYEGRQLDLYDYGNGVIRGTDSVMSLPIDAAMYNRHRNGNGDGIAVDYGNGCMDRLSLAKDTICGLIDRIAANSPGEAKSRVSYWSFAGTYWPDQEGEIDTDPERGIYNYIPLTSEYGAVKQKVNETLTYAGTYYQESMKRAYEQLAARTGIYKDMPSKVIFISDGKCSDDFEEVAYWNNRLREIPNCTIYTLAVGMPVASEGAQLLKNLSSNRNETTFAAFTTNLNSSNPAFADTLAAIEQASVEVKAVKKVMTDKIDTRYWDFVEVISEDGSAVCNNGILTWNIPEESGKTHRCSIKIRLKDAYRYLVSDTMYPTNRDADKEKGCRLEYEIQGGEHHLEKRTKETGTPRLKYGAVRVQGEKHWTISGSEADSVLLQLYRQLSGNDEKQAVNERTVTADQDWRYEMDRKRVSGQEILPLVLYNNAGTAYRYWLEEEAPYYRKADEKTEEKDGVLETDLYNEPYKIKIRMEKRDAETKKGLSGASFAVYAYSRQRKAYVPYCGNASGVSEAERVFLKEEKKGRYISENWLYYTPDNEGRFRIIEEKAPIGYLGDFKDQQTKAEKNVYDVRITKDNTGRIVESTAEGMPLCVENFRVKGKLTIYKKDADSHLPKPQGIGRLYYDKEEDNARYGLFAAEAIIHTDGETSGSGKKQGVLWEKDELVAEGRISPKGCLLFENLELGNYYVKELDTPPEGYLLDDRAYAVSICYEGEAVPVTVTETDVYETVKKQRQIIYKVSGTDGSTELAWLKNAGFSVIPFSSMGMEKLEKMTDEEILNHIDSTYRNPRTLTYEAMKELKTVRLYENGKDYLLREITGEDGIVETPPLPYGDYVMVETTVPKNMRPVRPVILHVRHDDEDGEKTGDGKGIKRQPKVLIDKDVTSNVRILKIDAFTGEPIREGRAAYLIRDVEGKWKEQYFAKATFREKAEYLLRYNGLVIEYDKESGVCMGTYEHPYYTEETELNGMTVQAAVTREGLPCGMYELEELEAPAGYILQGEEGCIAKDETRKEGNQTFYETQKQVQWKKTPREAVRFIIDEQSGTYDETGKCWWTEVRQENTPAIGKLSILAEGERYALDGEGKETEELIRVPQRGAEFELRAGEDILDGSGKKRYSKGDLVQRFVTDGEGKAWSGTKDNENGEPEGLPLGSYRLIQTKAGEGFTMEEAPLERKIELVYRDGKTPVIYRDEAYLLTPRKETAPSGTLEGTTTPETNGSGVSPKTGDPSRVGIFLLLFFISTALLTRRRKSR